MTKHRLSGFLSKAMKSLFALLVLLALLGWSSEFVITRSIISDVYRDFYSYTKDTPVDVLILGTSHSQCGINTLGLSKQLDASVYTLAMPAQGIGQTYYTLMDALHHTQPKIVIIGSYFVDRPGIFKDREYFAYEQIRAMESGAVKAEYLVDLVPYSDWCDALFPVIKEHQNWKEPRSREKNFFFNLGSSLEKNTHYNGFRPSTSVMTAETLGRIGALAPVALKPLPKESKEYMRQIVALCLSKGIKPVFVEEPLLPQYLAKVDYIARSQEIETFLKTLDTPWLDVNTQAAGFGPDDFRDESSEIGNNHLNIWGANRFTALLGAFLQENYPAQLAEGSHRVLSEPQQMLNLLKSLKKTELIFLTVRDDASVGWLPNELKRLRELNLTQLPVGQPRMAYAAVFKGDGTVFWEKKQSRPIDQFFQKDSTLKGLVMPVNVRITSAGPPNVAGQIFINENQVSMNSRGLNFVVYDLEQKKITKVELFDLYDRSLYLKDLLPE